MERMKRKKLFSVLSVFSVVMIVFCGCASAPWRDDIVRDPRLKSCLESGEPLPLRLAVAPVGVPPEEEPAGEAARERFALAADPQQIRRSIVDSLARFGIFSDIQPLDVRQAGSSVEAVMQTAWEEDFDLVLSLDIKNLEAFYDGVNGAYIPNIVNWLFLLVPSWWVKDEVYGARMNAQVSLRSARSGNLLYQEELSAQFKRSLNDFQRGWQFAGIFRVPGSLGESNWRRIGGHVLPGVLRELQVQTILGLQNEFRTRATEPGFERLLETRLGLIAGISRHKDYNIPKLKYTVEDAISVSKSLTGPQKLLPARNVRLLTDEQASRESILKGLDHLWRKSRACDSVVIYFAGYGVTVLAQNEGGDPPQEGRGRPTLYLVPYDADSRDIAGTCISLAQIEEKIEKIKAREVVIILDAGFGGGLQSRSLSGEAQEAPAFEKLLAASGRYVFLSGKPGEGAMEIDDHHHGAFTFYMLEGLKGPADGDKDGVITLGELHSYLAGKVAEETEMEGDAQHPELHGTGASDMVLSGSR